MKNGLVDTRAILTTCVIGICTTMWVNYTTVVRLEGIVSQNSIALGQKAKIDEKQTVALNDLLTRTKLNDFKIQTLRGR